jgi:hypothetical protein
VEQPSTNPLAAKLNCENDGSKFFEAMNVVGTETLSLSAEDIAGGLQTMSTVNFILHFKVQIIVSKESHLVSIFSTL